MLFRSFHKNLSLHILSILTCAQTPFRNMPVLRVLPSGKDLVHVKHAGLAALESLGDCTVRKSSYLFNICRSSYRRLEVEVNSRSEDDVYWPFEMMCFV